MKIGFIGLGIMGKPMALNLVKAGYDVIVYNRSKEAVKELVEAGADGASTSRELAEHSDLIMTMLPNSPDVEAVVFGENGVIEGIKEGSIFVDTSSINPLVSKKIAKALEEKGVKMVDAPVSGGEPKAIDGTLAFMVGGDEESFNTVKPVLEKMGSSVTLTGEIGSGNTTKLANQIIVALNIAAMSEAFVLATKAGVDPEKVYQAIRGGLAGSTVLDAKAPMVMEGNYKPGFRMELHIKDLNNALDTARGLDLMLPLTDSITKIMKSLSDDGCNRDDHGGIIQHFEKINDVKVRRGASA